MSQILFVMCFGAFEFLYRSAVSIETRLCMGASSVSQNEFYLLRI